MPFFTEWGKISIAQAQLLQSWFMLWIFLLEIPTGVVADYFGRKYSLALGALVVTLAAVIYGSAPNFYIFLLGEFLFAMAASFMSGADDALLYDSLKEEGREQEIKKATGMTHSIQLISIMVAAPIGSLIASKFGLNAPILFCAVPFLIAAFIAFSIKEPKVFDKTKETTRYWEIAKKGFSFFYRHKTLRLITLDAVIVSVAAYFVIWLYQPLLMNMKFPIKYFGWVSFLMVFSEVIIASNFVRLEKLFGSAKAYMRFSAIIVAGFFMLAAFVPKVPVVILFVIFAGGFGLTRLELMTAYMNRLIPSPQRATVLSTISMFRRLSLAVVNPFVGMMADRSLPVTLFIIGLLPLLIFFFVELLFV